MSNTAIDIQTQCIQKCIQNSNNTQPVVATAVHHVVASPVSQPVVATAVQPVVAYNMPSQKQSFLSPKGIGKITNFLSKQGVNPQGTLVNHLLKSTGLDHHLNQDADSLELIYKKALERIEKQQIMLGDLYHYETRQRKKDIYEAKYNKNIEYKNKIKIFYKDPTMNDNKKVKNILTIMEYFKDLNGGGFSKKKRNTKKNKGNKKPRNKSLRKKT